MIGVICKPDQHGVVEEFFQLFKTPWEFCRQDREYDVVLVTTNEIPEVEAKLLVIFGSETKSSDATNGVVARSHRQGALVNCRGMRVPIYGKLVTFDEKNTGGVCMTAASHTVGLRVRTADRTVMRVGYDLFGEVEFLLSKGQPIENAHIPTLDAHIMMLRDWILHAGISFVEIPPVPDGHKFFVCLTHDIDFAAMRYHKFDHTMWGFIYRATVGSLLGLLTKRFGWRKLLRNWLAFFSLPGIYLGLLTDFWSRFDEYLEIEDNVDSTFFFIPYKNDPGRSNSNSARAPYKRAASYDIADIPTNVRSLSRQGCEIALHGIDAWNDSSKGIREMNRVRDVVGCSKVGVRMHWLYFDENSPRTLESAGFTYDSTVGYNETIGHRAGTMQVFKPLGAQTLLELPLQIMDTALFSGQRMNLPDSRASVLCNELIHDALTYGGVLTINWHCRSLAPERLWGEFYANLLKDLKSRRAYFMTAMRAVEWFQKRREVQFDQVHFTSSGLRLRLNRPNYDGNYPLLLRIYFGAERDSANEDISKTTGRYREVMLPQETEVHVEY